MIDPVAARLISLDSNQATLENAGGKGVNLVRLTRAGFRVPPGFIIPTGAYRAFVQSNGLEGVIQTALEALTDGEALTSGEPAALASAAARIGAAFLAAKMPAALGGAICAAYAAMNERPVAVRSSATAEDLPDLSFAGQQDTYLNVIGQAPLLQAIVRCWASLWTARAIGYRARNDIAQAEVALAVVVQQMVTSEVSGVLFTANPLNGDRGETVIDATFGLGEALVAGQVEPDHFVVASRSGVVKAKNLGRKQLAARGAPGGGVAHVREDAAARQTLTEKQIQELTATGQKIQAVYQAPQDIEWGLVEDQIWVLQTRAITSLFPVPQVSDDPLIVWISFGSIQGLLGPLTPLGRDVIQHFVTSASARRLFGVRSPSAGVRLMAEAGERIWIKISDVLRHPIGRPVGLGFLGLVEPGNAHILRALAGDPRLGAGQGKLKPGTLWKMIRFMAPVLARMVGVLLAPEKARAQFDWLLEERLRTSQIAPAANPYELLASVAAFLQDQGRGVNAMPFVLPRFIPVFGPSMGLLHLLARLAGDEALALEVTRGLPRNVTTEMDLALWRTATAIRADPAAASLLRDLDAPTAASCYLAGALPATAQAAIAAFMQQYGMRGVGEIDFGQPRWREDPAPLVDTLKSYLEIDPAASPEAQFARGEQMAAAAVEALAARVRPQPAGWFKEKLVRAAARRIRLLMGARESPKFFAIRTLGIARSALLEAGRGLAAQGAIQRPEDLAFLNIAELEALARRENQDWKALIAGRRAVYRREQRRRQVPRVLASDGRAFYEGLAGTTDTREVLHGSPVSSGVVEGRVRVVFDPSQAQLAPGEILVCPGTDPAWTPLFLTAGGLITEVGGMMTHGSVVAREYGIPAVVGVQQATQRLKNGQRVRVDGTTGNIDLLTP